MSSREIPHKSAGIVTHPELLEILDQAEQITWRELHGAQGMILQTGTPDFRTT
jgi:hypothetical protein